ERPTVEDWIAKAIAVAGARETIFAAEVAADTAKEIRCECRRRDAEGMQFITRDLPEDKAWVMTSHALRECLVGYTGSAAIEAVRRGLKGAVVSEIKSSPAWRAKPTKGNRRL